MSSRPRVVSLVPSATETLLAWGVDVVACTRFCEQPSLRHVGGTKDPDIAAIVDLAPDVVVLDREENRKPDAEALVDAGMNVHVTHVTTLAHVPPTLVALAEAVAATEVRPAVYAPPSAPFASAFVPIWRRPWMTINADTYGASILRHVGVTNVFADDDERYPTVELDAVARRAPDLVLLPSEPYPFKQRHLAEVRRALLGADVRLIDGDDLFWWGVRTPAAIDRLTAALAPTR